MDRRTKNLTERLRPGDIAVIDHADLDALAARALADARVVAVVNARPFITGKYPNRGPAVCWPSRIPLFSCPTRICCRGFRTGTAGLTADGACPGTAGSSASTRWDGARVAEATEIGARESRQRTGKVRPQHPAVSGRRQRPAARPDRRPAVRRVEDRRAARADRRARGGVQGRPARLLRPYLREMRPALIAVDGGGGRPAGRWACGPTSSWATWTASPRRACAAARSSSSTPTRTASRPAWRGCRSWA